MVFFFFLRAGAPIWWSCLPWERGAGRWAYMAELPAGGDFFFGGRSRCTYMVELLAVGEKGRPVDLYGGAASWW